MPVAVRASGDLLHYYSRELSYLRQSGAEFAAKHPHVAQGLQLGAAVSPDPHVERLIEAVAFLCARVHLEVDAEAPQTAAALLDSLYPNLTRPIPPMSVACFEPQRAQAEKMKSGFIVPRDTELLAEVEGRAADGAQLRMRTCYPLTLWPLATEAAQLLGPREHGRTDPDDRAVLKLRLRCLGLKFKDLEGLGCLRLHLHGQWAQTGALYGLLSCNLRGIEVHTDHGEARPLKLPASALREVGFGSAERGDDDAVLPRPPHGHPAYVLLQEYFAFREKFLFFDLHGLEALKQFATDEVELHFILNALPPELGPIADVVRLGCTPVINLFRQVSEPITIDRSVSEYRLVPDYRHEATTEIYGIEQVKATDQASGQVLEVEPFLSSAPLGKAAEVAYWSARRSPCLRAGIPGSDVWLAFFDLHLKDHAPPALPSVFAHTLCTNRRLAEQLRPWQALRARSNPELLKPVLLSAATAAVDAPLEGEAQWRLLGLLNLGFSSLAAPGTGLELLRELLRLCGQADPARADHDTRSLSKLHCEPVMRPLHLHDGQHGWHSFGKGFEVRLEFDTEHMPNGTEVLFAAVLRHFFALFVNVNAFVETVLYRAGKETLRWPKISGRQTLL